MAGEMTTKPSEYGIEVQFPDGEVVTVPGSAGMSDLEVYQKALQMRPQQGEAGLEEPSFVGNLLNPAELVANVAGGAAVGSKVGGLGGGLLNALSKLRISGTGAAKDVGIASNALGDAIPAFKNLLPGGTIEELQSAVRGGAGQEVLSGARRAGLGQIGEALTRQTGPIADNLRSSQFGQLVNELAQINRAIQNPNTGQLRPTVAGLQSLRDKNEVMGDIRQTLGPELFDQFKQVQQDYAAGQTMQRLFEEVSQQGASPANNPLSAKGFDMKALQARVGNMQMELERVLGPDKAKQFMAAIFRGGMPPKGDQSMAVPLTRASGIRIPLGLDRLAGPGTLPNAELYGSIGGGILGGAAGASVPGLSELLRR